MLSLMYAGRPAGSIQPLFFIIQGSASSMEWDFRHHDWCFLCKGHRSCGGCDSNPLETDGPGDNRPLSGQ